MFISCISNAQRIFNFQNSWDYFIEEHGQFERRIKETYRLNTNDKIYYGLENKDFNHLKNKA